MRVNLLLNGTDIRAGFLNVDFLAVPGDGKILGNYCDLDEHVHDAEATEIIALDLLDYLSPHIIHEVLTHWISKLRHGGTLTIGGLDLREVARRLVNGQIGHDAANELIYGRQDFPWQYRKNTHPPHLYHEAVQALGLSVLKKSYDEFHYLIVAKRP